MTLLAQGHSKLPDVCDSWRRLDALSLLLSLLEVADNPVSTLSLRTSPYFLLLSNILFPLEVFQLLACCAKTSTFCFR